QQVQIIYQQHGLSLPEPTELPGLKEHAGTEGVKLAYPQLMQVPRLKALFEEQVADPGKRHRNTLLIFQYFMDEWTEGRITIPGIESWAEFRQMVKKSLDEIFVQTQKGEKIGIFTSGGTISSITAEALKLDREQRVAAMNFSVRNTSFSTFFYSRGQFNLLSFNELPHLPEEMITFV
ncbi:MAG: histidine phosphatase family protein, partial [Bacteroidota bacterium]